MEPGKPRLSRSVPLVPFTSPDPQVRAIRVTVERPEPTVLVLAWRLQGELAGLIIAPPAPRPQRRDGLWRHTCFEAFAGPAAAASYDEYNLAPSGDWAAYGFEDYRAGMRALDLPPPGIEVSREDDDSGDRGAHGDLGAHGGRGVRGQRGDEAAGRTAQGRGAGTGTGEASTAQGELLLRARLTVPAGTLRLALAAVVERADGTLGYWALRHGRERPDFHHADGFALTL